MAAPPPILVAHRGLHLKDPENSLAAFLGAWNSGFTWCECDLHLSADDVAVVIHDETLDRTTTGKGPVIAQTWAQLTRLHLRNADGSPSDQHLISLEHLIEQKPTARRLLVETKPLLGDRIVKLAQTLQDSGCMLQSFHRADVELADPLIDTALLLDKPEELRGSIRRMNVDHQLLSPTVIQNLLRSGHRIGAWTVNDRSEIQRLASMGVEMIITDLGI